MPVQPIEIKNQIVLEFITSPNLVKYTQKYTQARILLKNNPEQLKKIEKALRALNKRYGFSLDVLETLYYDKQDDNSFYNPDPKMSREHRITLLQLRRGLDRFLSELQDAVIDAYDNAGWV